MTARLIVTRSRAHTDVVLIRAALTYAGRLLGRDAVLIHGAARGADSIAARVWEGWGLPTEAFPANWEACTADCPPGPEHRRRRGESGTYCPNAGRRRNQAMVDAGAELALAFPIGASAGTHDCTRRAQAAGLEVLTISNYEDLADAYLHTSTAVLDDAAQTTLLDSRTISGAIA